MPEQGESGGFQRRLPTIDRKISEIGSEDIRVRITGTVVDKKGSTVVIDDGTGKAEVNFIEPKALEMCGVNKLVRVFGRVIPLESGFEFQGELAQDMSGLDLALMRRVSEMEK